MLSKNLLNPAAKTYTTGISKHTSHWQKYIDSCSCSVTKSCPTFCDPMDCSVPGFPVPHHFPEFAQSHSVESVMPSNHLILCCPLLLLPQSFPASGFFPVSLLFASGGQSIRASVSISPPNEYSGLISFRMTSCISLLSKGLSSIFSSNTV